MTKMRAATVVWMVTLSSAALAQTPPPGVENGHKACAADKERLCAGVERGGGRIIQCLQSHAGELSEGCKTAMAEMHGHRHGRGGDGGTQPPDARN